jgi:hypothetical protein
MYFVTDASLDRDTVAAVSRIIWDALRVAVLNTATLDRMSKRPNAAKGFPL